MPHPVIMKAENDKTLIVRCPTCGAKPGEKCEINNGMLRSESHADRRSAAEKK